MIFLWRSIDEDLRRREAAFADFFDRDLDGQSQRRDAREDSVGRHADVEQSRQRHITADAAEAIEMCYPHGCNSLSPISLRERGASCLQFYGAWRDFQQTRAPSGRDSIQNCVALPLPLRDLANDEDQ